MDPKLLRMYSDILSEAPAQQPPQTQPSAGGIWNAIKGTFQNAGRSNVNPTGPDGKPTAAGPGVALASPGGKTNPRPVSTVKPAPAKPAASPQAGRPATKPAADSMAARGKVDAMKGSQATAAQTDTSSYTGRPQTSPAAIAAAPAAPSLDQQKAAAIGGGMTTGTAAGFAAQDQTKDTYDPETDPSLAAGRAELAKAEPVNVAAAPGLGGYAQSATGAEGQGGTQAARPSSQGPAVTSGSGAAITTGSGGTLRSRSDDEIAKAKPGMSGFFEEESDVAEDELSEEQLEEAFNDMLRLSGLEKKNLEESKLVVEKAVSKQQQKFMGMVHAMQKGEKIKGASPELKKAAKTMGKKDAKDFASTKHKGLPQKVDESFKLMLDEEGHTLEHIVNRFKHEVKAFLHGDYMAENLYDALYDYYLDRGEMPYGVAKAREGDPYTWVSARFEADIDGTADVKVPLGEVGHDDTLNELAKLAGLSESKLEECGDMGMNQRDTINVSTNMSSDGNKSVNISAQGEKAEELLSMLKLAGMGGSDRSSVMVVDRDEEMMDEERETEYANTPEEEYETVAAITRQGNDLNREKRQYADKPKLGDNPMATETVLDEELSALLDSILVKEVDPRRPKGDTGQAEIFTADLGIQPPSPDEGPVGKAAAPKAPPAPAAPKTPTMAPGIKR
jgi:hypothetical protein